MIQFATIGTSKITEILLDAAKACPDFRYAAAYSRDLNKAKAFAAGHGARTAYDSLEALAADHDIDAVYIASPNAAHYAQALPLMRAGKHILCEKALASNLAEARDMFACAREHHVLLMEAMRSIHDPGYDVIRQSLSNLGAIRRAELRFCQYSSRYDAFKKGIPQNIFDVNCSAGAIMDIGVYCVHAMVALFGAPQEIKASSVLLPGGIDGLGSILASYPDMTAELIYSKITASSIPSEIQGENGVMLIPSITNPSQISIRYHDGTTETIRSLPFENNMKYELAHFVDAIQTQSSLDQYQEISLTSMGIMEEARRQCGIIFPADKRVQPA